MDSLHIEATKSTPYIHYGADENILDIMGESYPENAAAFYSPVFRWLDEFLAEYPNRSLTVNIELLYFNSSSSKALMNLFDRFENAAENGWTITVNWIYQMENETARECGEEFQEDYDVIAFNMTAISRLRRSI